MILDYTRYPIAKFLESGSGDYEFYRENYSNSSINAKYLYETKKEVRTERTGFLRKQTKEHVSIVKDESKRGVGYRCSNLASGNYVTNGLRVLSKRENGEEADVIVNVNENLMPVLAEQPKTYEELKMLVMSDPRFLAQIVPSTKILNPKDSRQMKDFTATVEQAVEDILYSQIEMNIPWNEQEQVQAEKYKNSCIAAHKTFIQSMMRNVLKYRSPQAQS